MFEFWSERRPVAAKQHRCEACGQDIAAGTQYVYMSGKFDGQFQVTKQHIECRDAEVAISQEQGLSGGEEWVFLNDLQDVEDLFWIKENHPAAFERIKGRYACWLESE